MANRELGVVSYLPILSVRPAEMKALQELPERDKDLLLPCFKLRPWAGAHHLSSALDRIEDAYGERPYFLDLAEEEPAPTTPRPVHEHLAALRLPAEGYANWCEFIEQYRHIMPAAQVGEPAELSAQVARLFGLGRGLLVPIPRRAFDQIDGIARTVGEATNGGVDVCFLLDFGRAGLELLQQQIVCAGYVRTISAHCPQAIVSFSASSFPDSFTNIDRQDIYERQLFDGVRMALPGARLIYSDRGSARAERQGGGGGLPAPRIDYAQASRWRFYRADNGGDRMSDYQTQAEALVDDPDVWDPELRLWGTQMIERTSLGDLDAIISPARSTAVRINIHLHQQLFYGEPGRLHETDEDWSD
ncbi:MAG: beta family protein [Brevundimonas sp.]|nr:beta family protein [Brevundimonas sp.]